MRILVVNAGSSSLKLSVLERDDTLTAAYDFPAPGGSVDTQLIERTIRKIPDVDAVGHRIVHGGIAFTSSVIIDDDVVARLRALTDLAPLHQSNSLQALSTVSELLPEAPAVACFDTAFHARMPEAATTYPLPLEWRTRWHLRRFGFHGLSHAYASRRACEVLARSPEGTRMVTCHLGAGASLAAVQDGRSVDTTMGFTPLEGLVMATRSGSVDPGLVLWLEEHAGMPPAELAATLEHRSGLLALAGTPDMRAVLAAEETGAQDAHLAVEVYLHRLRAGIAAMAAAMGGLDVLVFTGGVGENADSIRQRAAEGLQFLGVKVDPDRNGANGGDRNIGSNKASVDTLVIAAREDLQIAHETRQVLEPGMTLTGP